MPPQASTTPAFFQILLYVQRKFYDQVRSGATQRYVVSYIHSRKMEEIRDVRLNDSLVFICEEDLSQLPQTMRRDYQKQIERVVVQIEEDNQKKKKTLHFRNQKNDAPPHLLR